MAIFNTRQVGVIIPALNEEEAIPLVVRDALRVASRVIVVDNGSSDATKNVAKEAGAVVLTEERRGYGYACLRGIESLRDDPPAVVAFMDGDYSDHPEELPGLVTPVLRGEADLMIGSRVLGRHERGALAPQQVFGNWLATSLIHLFWHVRFSDLGPFRAVAYKWLVAMDHLHPTFGWTVDMQIRAASMGLRCAEIPVRYRRRIGKSKVSGTVSGSVKAGALILTTIFRRLFEEKRRTG
ncbi:MAG: glycosyltransferase family 2 protein [Chlorobi bacterium]|nr:glycosyltransferase family 2 protein [Chlorobiota bacterium]